MVLINDKKFACATCIKGHRVSGCTHTDRPLFEVKKKGRPATQCPMCREKRKGGSQSGSVHTKCACGDLKSQQPAAIMLTPVAQAVPPNWATTTRKGVPGSTPTFPNGLRDVHEMAAAVEALTDLGGESNLAAERNLENLLNPCQCRTTGKCKCCAPRRRSSPPRSPGDPHSAVTESLIEMFKSKATTSPEKPGSGQATPVLSLAPHLQHLSMTLASPAQRNHPAHTSPHVHKTRLYSPYSPHGTPRPNGKQRSASVSSASSHWTNASPRPPPPRLRPLADMGTFLGAVFNDDGSIANEIPRSALGLPGIHTFDSMALNGGAKVEPMEMEVDAPVSFPIAEDVVIGGCTCGEGCECPGCATHANAPSSSNSPKEHGHDACGSSCKSCFDCGGNLAIPSGVASIEQLIQLAAANVPAPPKSRQELNPLDTSLLPSSAHLSEDTARAFGVTKLKPLECCNGRCQCSPGECKCESECCGCCKGCNCGEDGDELMRDGPAKSGCCGSTTKLSVQTQQLQVQTSQLQVPVPSSQSSPHSPSPTHRSPLPSPTSPARHSRRTSSISRAKEASNGPPSARRLSASNPSSSTAAVQRSTSLGSKPTAKALALHTGPRPILPKPSIGRLAPPRTASIGSRVPSPISPVSPIPISSASSQTSSQSSPAFAPVQLPPPIDFSFPSLEPPAIEQPRKDSMTDRMSGMSIGVDDIATALAASEVDFMAYLNQLMPPDSGFENVASGSNGVANPSVVAPDLLVNGSAPALTPKADLESNMGDIQELIAGALAQQGIFGNNTLANNTQPMDENYFLNLLPPEYQFGSTADVNMELAQPQPQPFDANAFFMNNALSLQAPPVPQVQVQRPTSGDQNPDIIDLSKPLNPGDIDRILHALNRQTQPAPPQPTLSRAASHSSNLSTLSVHDDPFDQFMFDPSTVDSAQQQQGARQPSPQPPGVAQAAAPHPNRDWLQ